jgi:diaminohydroxyphosphoribosylaminopyrimidine deaminase/5-amino-6-(5-phosphoribosylamino)uracil reductase
MVKAIRRIVLDSRARTPLTAKVVTDESAALTTIVVNKLAPKKRVAALAKRVNVLVAPAAKTSRFTHHASLDLRWLLKKLGTENITSLLVEGGGEVNASFLLDDFTQRVAFFYAPKILGGRDSRKAVAGDGAKSVSEVVPLREIMWRKLGEDLLLTARVNS